MWQPISSEHRVLHKLWRKELRGYRSTINVGSVYICDLQRPLFRSECFHVVCTGTEHKCRAHWRQNAVSKAFQVKLFGNRWIYVVTEKKPSQLMVNKLRHRKKRPSCLGNMKLWDSLNVLCCCDVRKCGKTLSGSIQAETFSHHQPSPCLRLAKKEPRNWMQPVWRLKKRHCPSEFFRRSLRTQNAVEPQTSCCSLLAPDKSFKLLLCELLQLSKAASFKPHYLSGESLINNELNVKHWTPLEISLMPKSFCLLL